MAQRSRLAARRTRTAWLFLLPSLLVLLVVAAYPLWRTFQLSFYQVSILQFPLQPEWVGLENYRYLLADPYWWISLKNTAVFTVVSVALETVLGLGIALVVNANFTGRGLMRTAMLVPWAIPTVVSAQMWRWMYNDVYGVVNDLLMRAHLISEPLAWLADPHLALSGIIAVDVWKTTPFMALLLLAGLQSIPRELYEASTVDGASPWQQFWRITLPLLKPALLVALIFRTLDALRVFDVIYVMTGTNPTTMSMSVYARQQLVDFGALGYGSAVSMGIFLIIALFAAAYLVSLRVELD
ncbi:maltose ABC transporter membrane protein;trehalose ABC transporter membrane protein;palatinose ABC transporter membrane protein;sucrose ABC transporter membrane protein [Oceanithermus profundus DSM 14977]|uniref:Maltose ABC transporter membrane proteintrehalose ABC transporter membrane proteinpalatinose ABC transporter membrane proteinsucrose ABC transporter membrane protein n=1 Tax=Oceanithermus profundus (strain DSM 14977 / NBRC 100410 / VKM B-2274 / 506) TaxID=670487 RepID=E4U6W2_OCEP5|nr:sugar ABC transporter permease [Oceanithermus profundus]ADR35965.1 maltose ABC transporter membrane protein;trehalose ABC transporter membrane protein;palatinose ABC transporter membrane protein;sucrose ABC transporter membrane protein [Oceanithermus profundus DSM 14977]